MSSTNHITDFDHPSPVVLQNFPDGAKLQTILDLGSGRGRDSLYLARLGHKVTALDNYEPWLGQLRDIAAYESLHVRCINGDIRSYQPDESCGAVLALMVLHYLTPGEIDDVIGMMQQCTSPGGLNIITAYTDANPADTRPYLFKSGELRERYQGWEIETCDEMIVEHFTPQGESEAVEYVAAHLVARKPA